MGDRGQRRQPARLAAVLDGEVVVGPRLKLGIVVGALGRVLIAHGLVRAVEVFDVLLEEIRRRQVRPAAEPPDAALAISGTVGKSANKIYLDSESLLLNVQKVKFVCALAVSVLFPCLCLCMSLFLCL